LVHGRFTGEEINARVKELADRNAAIRKHYETPISLTPQEKSSTPSPA